MTRLDPDGPRPPRPAGSRMLASGTVDVPRTLAATPIVWRGAGAAVGLIALLTARTGVSGLFDEIVGSTMVAIALVEQVPRVLGGARLPWWRTAVLAAAGATMVVWPSETARSVGALAALAIAAYGVGKSVQAVTSAARERRGDRLARGILMIALAIVVALFSEATVRVVVIGTAVLWILRAAFVTAAIGRAGGGDGRATDITAPHAQLSDRLARREMGRTARDRIDAVLFYDDDDGARRLFRFGILMGLSTAIATFGIATGSTAVVIGAMLIAPLMTPILATASAILHGWTVRALRSGAIVLVASVGAVGFAYVLAGFVPDLAAVVANDEVTSRTAPNLLDLAIAVAAGAAGAFAVNRSDVSDTLPGVAVAIALVPPLAVTGVTLYAGSVEQALGAVLLFGTNLMAIVAMASIVFVLTGYVAWSRLVDERRRVRASYATVAAGVVLLLIPLGLTTRRVVTDAAQLRAAHRAVDVWLADAGDVRLSQLEVGSRWVTVAVHGPGPLPSPDGLHAALVDELGGEVVVELRVVPEVVHVVGGGGP